MFFIIHILMGALIAKVFPSIIPIVLFSLISHFILDFIPHWDGDFDDKTLNKKNKVNITRRTFILRTIDLILAGGFLFLVYVNFQNYLMILGALVSFLPDMTKGGYYLGFKNNKIFQKYLKFHTNIQSDPGIKVGLIIQIVIFIMLITAIF